MITVSLNLQGTSCSDAKSLPQNSPRLAKQHFPAKEKPPSTCQPPTVLSWKISHPPKTSGGIKRLQQYFEVVLESEVHLDKSKAYLTSCEKNEIKIRKEFDKLNERSTLDMHALEERKMLNDRLLHAAASINAAQQEVNNKSIENETLKVVKIKEGMSDFSESSLELAYKTSMIFSAHAKVVSCLPDARSTPLEDLKYSGSEISRRAVGKAKNDVHCYKRPSETANAPPPPYTSNPSSPVSSPISSYGAYSSFSSPVSSIYAETDGRYCEIPEYPQNSELQSGSPRYDLPPRENYENLAGAVGGMNISSGVPPRP